MKLDTPKNGNYAATVVSVHTLVELAGLDNLVGVPVVGHQALTTKGIQAGDLRVAFTAETQLSEDYCYHNSLYRDAYQNKDETEKGYLEKNRRVRAIKLRGHVSNALLMPLSSLAYTGINPADLVEGDTFDTLNGHDVCCKYEIPVKHHNHVNVSKVEKAFKRVDAKLFPEHISTDQYHRNKHLLQPGREVVITQKLHGSSIRVGRVPCLRQKPWLERMVNKLLRVKTPDYAYDVVYGSRKVIKDAADPNQNHYYQTDGDDLWTHYGKKVADLLPEGIILYGELVGFTPQGQAIQKNYTYGYTPGECELFVYRVASINAQGHLSDLSWDGVRDFCRARGLKWVPELFRCTWEGSNDDDELVDDFMDRRLAEYYDCNPLLLPLSGKKTVDEGICLRQEGLVPLILKAKSPKFLEHETKLLDSGECDLESAA